MMDFPLEVFAMKGLMCGKDPTVSHVRGLLLSSVGLDFEYVVDVSHIKSLCETNEFKLAVICHTLSDFERQVAIDTITSRCKDASILILSSGDGWQDCLSQYQVEDVLNGPVALLKKCEEILRESKST
jgi:hypothetical protein